MGREDPRFLVVGHISKSHGTKGELFVWPLTDHPGSVYAPVFVLTLADADADGDVDLFDFGVFQTVFDWDTGK